MSKRYLIATGVFVSIICAGLIYGLSQTYLRGSVRLTHQIEQQTQLQTLTALMLKELGYTGFIHNFKNYVLRGDDQYYAAARENMNRLERFLFESRHLSDDPAFELNYQNLFDTLAHYKASLELAKRLVAQGLGPAQIDAQVKVDDTTAALALRKIITHYQAALHQSMHDLEQYNDNALKIVLSLIAAALMLGVSSSLVLLYYSRAAQERLGIIARLSAKQKLLDAAPNPMLVMTEGGVIEFANEGATRLFEAERAELVGQHLQDLFPKGFHYERFRQHFFSSGGDHALINPVTIRTLRGNLCEVEICMGMFNLEGERYAVANIMDVSQVLAYRERLDAAERKFLATFEMAPIGIIHLDLKGELMRVNPCFASMLGYRPGEMEHLSLQQLCHADERDNATDFIGRLINQDLDFFRIERRFLHRNGSTLWCNLVATLNRDMKGMPQYVIGVVEDVTQRRNFEQHLLNSERKFKAIAQHVNGVVWMSTPGVTRVLFVSEAYERIWQRTRESLYGNPRSFIDAVVPEDRHRVMDALKSHSQGQWKVKYRIERPDGTTRHIEDEGTAVRNDDGEILFLVGLARDVTEEQLFRERLQQTNQHLERLARFDPLTMAIRRQYALTDLEECIALHRRYQTDATLIFVDLDDFKDVNDRHGHEVGDEVLMEFCRVVRNFLRETDAFYRYAGDEFLILLRETPYQEAAKVVEKMIRRLPTVQVGIGNVVKISFTCGIQALGNQHCDSARDWIRLADEQMYMLKRRKKEPLTEQA